MTIEAAGPDGAARETPRQIDELRRAKSAEADTPTKTRRAAVVYNPVKVRVADLRALIEPAAAEAGWAETQWVETSVEDPGEGVTRELARAGIDMVFAAGGDGTVRSVAQGLRDSGASLAIIPSGTGNLLARNLNLPLSDVPASVAIAFQGTDRKIDLGIVTIGREDGPDEKHAFLVMAGMGIDATIMANTNPALKKAVGWLAYVDAGMRALPKARPFKIRYQLRGRHEHTAHVSTILFGNCGTLPGNIELLPDAVVDDGLLDIAFLQPKGVFGWVQVWRKVRWENSALAKSSLGRTIVKATDNGGPKMVTYLRSESTTIVLEEPQEIELDGDEFGRATRARFSTDAGALLVRVPAV